VNFPGATVKFTVTDLNGVKFPRVGAQLAQSAYSPLQTPYTVHGLGRTNNYIEEFYVGIPYNYGQGWQMWIAQIPNSQLVCFPYPPGDPVNWLLELFVSPSTRLFLVTVALVSTLVGLGILIAFLHYRERKQEAEEKQKTGVFMPL